MGVARRSEHQQTKGHTNESASHDKSRQPAGKRDSRDGLRNKKRMEGHASHGKREIQSRKTAVTAHNYPGAAHVPRHGPPTNYRREGGGEG